MDIQQWTFIQPVLKNCWKTSLGQMLHLAIHNFLQDFPLIPHPNTGPRLSWCPNFLLLRQLRMSIFPPGTKHPRKLWLVAPWCGDQGQTPTRAGLFFLVIPTRIQARSWNEGPLLSEERNSLFVGCWQLARAPMSLGVCVCTVFVWDHLRITSKIHRSANVTLSDNNSLVGLSFCHFKLKK